MWNIQLDSKIQKKYNLLFHQYKNNIILYKNDKFKIVNVYKNWNCGWYLSVELQCISSLKYNCVYIEIPFQNINSENPTILQQIQDVQNQIQLLKI